MQFVCIKACNTSAYLREPEQHKAMLAPNFFPFPNLITERLVLREITRKDAPAMFRLRSNEEVVRYLARDPMRHPSEANKFITSVQKDQFENNAIAWGITFKEDRASLIGNVSFWRIDKKNHRAEIGYILHPQYWGRGIMQEAVAAALAYGFNQMQLHSIEAHIDPANSASEHLLLRNGFVREAYFRENYYYNGAFLDTAVYSLLHTPAP